MSEADADPARPADDGVGYRHTPRATRFQKGKSGNPLGRPRNRHRAVPYDTVLGQMVTIREDGKERRVTAAEAFLLQLVRKGLGGDSSAARASLAAIEAARQRRKPQQDAITVFRIIFMTFSIGLPLRKLGLAIKKYPLQEGRTRWELQPWIVEMALARMAPRRLTPEEQQEVWNATHRPDKVAWPDWWVAKG